MKRISILTLIFLTCFALAAWPQAQTQTKYQQYKLHDLGTLGGPDSVNSFFVISLTNKGVIGSAQTAASDPFNPNCCLLYTSEADSTGPISTSPPSPMPPMRMSTTR